MIKAENKRKDLETPLPELDIFGLPLVQKSVVETLDTVHFPVSYSRTWTSSSVIEFVLNLADDEYILLHETSIYFHAILTKRGTGVWHPADPAEAAHVTPVNNLFHSLIDRVQLRIGSAGHVIDITDYAYKAYLSTLLGYNEAAKKTHLGAAGWSSSMEERQGRYIKAGKDADIYLRGRLFYDFEHQCRGIIGGSKIHIKINLKPPRFFLVAQEDKTGFGAEVAEVRLHSRVYRLAESKVKAHFKALQSVNARYPMTTTQIKTAIIQKGSTVVHADNIVTGKIPTRMFVALVSKTAYTGTLTEDPYVFKPYKMASICCNIDGAQWPNGGMNMDFEREDIVDAYYTLFQILNQHDADTVCEISMQDFMESQCVFAFNFTQDRTSGYSVDGHCNAIKQGHMQINMRFAQQVPYDLVMIAMCEFDTLYEIDEFHNLILKQ